MKKTAYVLFSGGMDSTAALAWALQNDYQPTALFFDYGQRHISEHLAAETITRTLNVPLFIFKTDALTTIGGSSLTTNTLQVKQHDFSKVNDTFVPGRNILFITIAAAMCYVNKINTIITGIRESVTFPDCRVDTLNSLENTLQLGISNEVIILHPFFNVGRDNVAEYLMNFDKRLAALTVSCYNGTSCGYCKPCVDRRETFQALSKQHPDWIQYFPKGDLHGPGNEN